ncbi:MAG: DMT family transporter [Leptospiraceae bacterium]|nr:DMT family transporter [Leptospiraceae bacterium]
MRLQSKPEWMLVLCTVIWGGTFPAVKYALKFCSPWLIVALRFAFAGVLFALFLRGAGRYWNRQLLLRGFILGVFFFAGFGLQTLGLQWTTTSRSAFLTESLVLFIPLISFAMSRKLPSLFTVAGAILVMAGLYLLTSPAGFIHWNRGDWLTLGCALAFSLYIIGVDLWSTPDTRGLLSAVQAFTVAVLAIPMTLTEGIRWQAGTGLGLAMAYLVLPGTLIVVMLQMRYQPLTTPSRAGVVFALEPVFAMVFAVAFAFEEFSRRAAAGAATVTLGVILSEVGQNLVRAIAAIAARKRLPPVRGG